MRRLNLLIVVLFSLLLLVEGSSRVLLAKKGKGTKKGGNKNKRGGNKNKRGGNKNKRGGNKNKKGGNKNKKGGDKNGWPSSDSASLSLPLSYPQTTEEKFHPSRVIVKYKSLNGADGVSISGASGKWRSVNTGKGESVAAAMKRLKDDPNVASVEEDFIVQAFDATPSDPEFMKQWGWSRSGILKTWDYNFTGSSKVKVCVIDTGIASDHVDLRLNTAPGIGYWLGNVVTSYDGDNHGSHIAGVIGASVDSIGVAGMNKAVTMIPCRFISPEGWGHYERCHPVPELLRRARGPDFQQFVGWPRLLAGISRRAPCGGESRPPVHRSGRQFCCRLRYQPLVSGRVRRAERDQRGGHRLRQQSRAVQQLRR